MRGKMMNHDERYGFFHVCTDGTVLPWMFKDKDDFIAGINRIGICCYQTGVLMYAFTLMDNHVHFVMHGTRPMCKVFINRYKLLTGKHIAFKYGDSEHLRNLPAQIIRINSEEELMETIAYLDRNPIIAGYRYLPADYLWGSARFLFRETVTCPEEELVRLKDLSPFTQRKLLKTHIRLPEEWTVDSQGMISPECFLEWKKTEKLFGTPVRYIYFLSRKLEGKLEMKFDSNSQTFIRDKELRIIVENMAGKKDIRSLDFNTRIAIGRRLKYEYAASVKQISRMIYLETDILKKFI